MPSPSASCLVPSRQIPDFPRASRVFSRAPGEFFFLIFFVTPLPACGAAVHALPINHMVQVALCRATSTCVQVPVAQPPNLEKDAAQSRLWQRVDTEFSASSLPTPLADFPSFPLLPAAKCCRG